MFFNNALLTSLGKSGLYQPLYRISVNLLQYKHTYSKESTWLAPTMTLLGYNYTFYVSIVFFFILTFCCYRISYKNLYVKIFADLLLVIRIYSFIN